MDCLALAADIPFGVLASASYQEQELQLEPGDRLVVVTDGLLERNGVLADFDIATALAETVALHPRQVVHVFKGAVLAADGTGLADAAVLCIDWHGGD